MTNAKKIKMALAFKSKSESELARDLGTTPQAFNQRMKTDKFSTDELNRIAEILGCFYKSSFEFPDGTKI
jgi:DNA-binding Xre family transcriptional regulator